MLVREWFRSIVVGTVRARPFLIDLAVVASDAEERVSSEMFADLREQPSIIERIAEGRQPPELTPSCVS